MDRIIEVNVGGNYLKKNKKKAGVRGEANVQSLRITFDESWDGYQKRVTLWDARGLNPRYIELLEHLKIDERVYLVPIPKEPMAEAGELTFIIDGLVGDKVQRSFSDKLEVEDAPISSDATRPVTPTPSEVEQMREQLLELTKEIAEAMEAKEDIENMSVSAEPLSAGVASVTKTEKNGVVNLHFGLPAGNDGYTPKAGTDYWTEAEKEAISAYVADKVGETEGAVEAIIAIQNALINGEPVANVFSQFALFDLSNVPDEVLRAKIESLMTASIEEHTHSASEIGASPIGHTHTKSEITDFPTSMPASDVPSWAKQPNKPSYTASELGIKSETWTFTLEDGSTTTKKVLVL